MFFFNKFQNKVKFKTFRKNLKFKKYNLGVTKYIKNRKKYFVRKRTKNFMNLYHIINNWVITYKICKQDSKVIQTRSILNVVTLPIFNNINLNHFNFFNVSKKIIFNSSLFIKKTINFNNSLFYFYNYTNLTKGTILCYNKCFFTSKILINNTNSTTIFINFIQNYLVALLKLYRKYFILLILSSK